MYELTIKFDTYAELTELVALLEPKAKARIERISPEPTTDLQEDDVGMADITVTSKYTEMMKLHNQLINRKQVSGKSSWRYKVRCAIQRGSDGQFTKPNPNIPDETIDKIIDELKKIS